MITVKYGKPKKIKGIGQSIFVSFRYNQTIVNAIRMITPRYWHANDKVWELSYDSLSELKELLPREEFDIVGKPIDKKKYKEKEVDHSITLPKALKTKLFPYQKETFDEGMAYDKYIYNLDPGLGKTITTLATVAKRMELGHVKKCLIIVAVYGLQVTWYQEINKHFEGFNCKILGSRKNTKGVWRIKGSKDKLEDINTLGDDCQFYITNIETIRDKKITDKLVKLMDKGVFNCIVVDEVHRAINPGAQQSKALLRLENHVKYSYLLTGTILLNKPNDLYIPLKITGAQESNFTQFKQRYNVYGGFGGWSIIGYKHLDELQAKLGSVSKRLRKTEVLKDLPPKIYKDEYVEMKTKQKKIYRDVLNDIVTNIDNISLGVDPLAQMIRLRQATADTSILSSTVKESAKFDRALELINEMIDSNESVIVFSNWETVISNFKKYLKVNKIDSAIVTGKIKDRESEINKFLNNKDCSVMLGTIGALGTGYTLNKASNVIFLDEPWTSAIKIQAEDRCHRVGQKNNVVIYTLMCLDTIDANIHKVVARKGALGDALVDKMFNLNDKNVLNFLLTGEGNIDGK